MNARCEHHAEHRRHHTPCDATDPWPAANAAVAATALLCAFAWVAHLPAAGAQDAPRPAAREGGVGDPSATIIPAEAAIGDRLELRFELTHPAGWELRSEHLVQPDRTPVMDRASTTEPVPPDQVRSVHTYEIAVLDLGTVTVATGALQLVTAAGVTNIPIAPVTVRIHSVLTPEERRFDLATGVVRSAEDATQLMAKVIDRSKPPRAAPLRFGWLWWSLLVPATGLFVLALVLWLVFRKPKPKVVVPPAIVAHRVARDALEALREEGHHERGESGPFYTKLSGIARRYLEMKFGLHAPDRTTEEFLREAAVDGSLDEAQQDLVAGFLRESDLVKFARATPDRDQMEQAFAAAERLVETTAAAEDGAMTSGE